MLKPFFKYSDSFLKTLRFFKSYFNFDRHDNIPSHKAIKNWVSLFINTARTQTKTGGSTKTVQTPYTIERVREESYSGDQKDLL